MRKLFIMWALICATAFSMHSQNHIENTLTDCDTIEYSISPYLLNEIQVTASPIINKVDRKVLMLSKETLDVSADGVDLLRKMNLPRITVNPMTNAISVIGGGDVILCINGIESTMAQIKAINPKDIIRIEYHDNPGVRYEGAEIVIDYITTLRDSGGRLSFDSFSAFENGRWATIDHIAGQYNKGNSVWSVNAGYMGQRKDKWLRDYDETWHYPDYDVIRHESGMPVTVGGSGLESTVNYSYQHSSGNIFNARLGLDINDVPNKEEGDRRALLHMSDSETPIIVTEHTEEHSVLPTMALYYKHRMSENRSLVFETQGTYMHSQILHEYSEDLKFETNRVNGDKYSIKLLGMFENRVGGHALNIGISNNSSVINNTYYNDNPGRIQIKQSETSIFGEYSNRFGDWGIIGSIKAFYRNISQGDKDIDKVCLSTTINISYQPVGFLFMRYSASLDYKMPSAAEISDVVQPIQVGMVRKGNPDLHPFRIITQSFDASFDTDIISLNTRVEYRNESKPIMESVIFDGKQFIRTYFNQCSFQRLTAGGSVSLRPWKNHLTISAEPTLMRYFSHGLDYHHSHNIFRLGLGLDFNYNNWLVYANIMSGPANHMYGEEIIEEKDMNQIMVGYKRDMWSLHIGVFNAFMKNYWMETRNLSAIAPYTSKARSDRSCSYIAVKFNIALDFGRGSRDVELHEMDVDDDAGILTGTK